MMMMMIISFSMSFIFRSKQKYKIDVQLLPLFHFDYRNRCALLSCGFEYLLKKIPLNAKFINCITYC